MRADLDNNGTISLIDLAILASTYRESIPPAPARYDQGRLPRDGKITLLDLAQLAGVYQKDVSDCR
jgi:hypothetical protein